MNFYNSYQNQFGCRIKYIKRAFFTNLSKNSYILQHKHLLWLLQIYLGISSKKKRFILPIIVIRAAGKR